MKKDHIASPYRLAMMDMVAPGISARAAYLKDAMIKEQDLHRKDKLKEEFMNEMIIWDHDEARRLLLTMSKQEMSLLTLEN